MLGGRPISSLALLTASTASPSAALGARLNDKVTTGNWPWWLMAMGALWVSVVLNAASGTWPPFGNAVVDAIGAAPLALLDPVELRLFCDEVAELTGPLLNAVPVPPVVIPPDPLEVVAPVRTKSARRSRGFWPYSGFTSRMTWY